MKNLKFEFGEEIKKYLVESSSDTLYIEPTRVESEYAAQCEIVTDTRSPRQHNEDNFEKYVQDGINFYVSKDLNLEGKSTISLSTKDYASDLSGRDIDVKIS